MEQNFPSGNVLCLASKRAPNYTHYGAVLCVSSKLRQSFCGEYSV